MSYWLIYSLPYCPTDGAILKIDKSVLIKMLEKKIITQPPKNVDSKFVDDFFILHIMSEDSRTFGTITNKILHFII